MSDLERCAWCGNEPATDEHHLFRRSTSPEMVEEKENLVKLGRRCHDFATRFPDVEKLFQEYFFLKQDKVALTVEFIADRMKNQEILSPRDIDRYRRFLAAQYFFFSEEYRRLEAEEPFHWNKLREGVKSDTRADKMYGMTDVGIKHHNLKLRLKEIEKMMSSLKGAIEQFKNEGFNIF